MFEKPWKKNDFEYSKLGLLINENENYKYNKY